MAKQTGQITVLKNNTVTNVEHQIRFIFTKENGERITRDTTSKGVINFDIPNGEWNVSWFAVDGDQKVLPLRAGLQLKITSSTPPTALADWIYGDNTHVADPILAGWKETLDEMKAVRDSFRDETQRDGTGKFVMQSSVKKNSLRDAGSYHTQNNPENIDLWEAGRHGLMTNIVDNIPADVRELLRDSFMYVETKGIYSANLSNKWQSVLGYRNPEIVIRQYTPGASGGWTSAKLLSTYNTTVDSNGNIKAASPVINLFADHIEPNNHFSQQYEKKPIFEKIGIGCYKISNTQGLAKGEYAGDWNVEVPKNINGERYFNTEWEQLEDNTVIIRTYEREAFTEEYQRYDEDGNALTDTQGNVLKFYKRHEINGKPVDIKAGRFIALRFLEDEEAKAKREAETEMEE